MFVRRMSPCWWPRSCSYIKASTPRPLIIFIQNQSLSRPIPTCHFAIWSLALFFLVLDPIGASLGRDLSIIGGAGDEWKPLGWTVKNDVKKDCCSIFQVHITSVRTSNFYNTVWARTTRFDVWTRTCFTVGAIIFQQWPLLLVSTIA